MRLPSITIIIPCRNEEKFIGQCLDSIIANDFPKNKLEILVMDGRSQDNTRNIIQQYVKKAPYIKLIDNPTKLKSHALNKGIKIAQGEIIVRMDAHAKYKKDYLSKSVFYLQKYPADNVGGIRRHLPGSDSLIAKAIALSLSQPLAAGNARFRTGAKKVCWVDTVFGGCYKKGVFKKIGFFNENLIRTQDREFNVRLRRAGGKILLAPDIECFYYARSKLPDFIKWIFLGGMWPFYARRFTKYSIISWRNCIPLIFILSLTTSFLSGFWWRSFWRLFIVIVIMYLTAIIFAAVRVAWAQKNLRYLTVMPLIFILTHLPYGAGSIWGLIKLAINDKSNT